MQTRMMGLSILLAALVACEDGPEQQFQPLPDNTEAPSSSGGTWTEDGQRRFDDTSGGDRIGSAQFCDENEAEAQTQEMVQRPIVPNQGLGGLPLLGPDDQPYIADTLLGRPEDGLFCDPTGVYSNAFTWGPVFEIIALFDTETRQVTDLIARPGYLGTLSGTGVRGGESTQVNIALRERVKFNGRELEEYAGLAERDDRPNSWLNPTNITTIYAMLRQTFFEGEPLPADYNCVAAKVCDVIYTSDGGPDAEPTLILFRDSGLYLYFTPTGQLDELGLSPVRVAPFEVSTEFDFGDSGTAPTLTSNSVAGCAIDLNAEMTFSQFKRDCVDGEGTLNRANYDVWTVRDAVTVEFNGVDISFMRRTSESGVLTDGERPGEDDVLFDMTFTSTLGATVNQFVPSRIAAAYKEKLEARIRGSVSANASANHPFRTWELTVPADIADRDQPQPLDVITTSAGFGQTSWIDQVLAGIDRDYRNLDDKDREVVDNRILEPIFLIEPFVDAVLDTLTDGAASGEGAYKLFRSTDDKRWSIGFGYYMHEGVPYRVTVQYSLNFGYITAISVSRGFSEVDEVFNAYNGAFGEGNYPLWDLFGPASTGDHPYTLGGDAIEVLGFDRKLNTVDVSIAIGRGNRMELTTSGDPIEDRNGYSRQTRGETYEFVPANVVRLYGKETALVFYVEASGEIGRIDMISFKGPVELCDGLQIRYGDDLPRTIKAWQEASENGATAFRDCELVFDYSADGTVLDGVTSLHNKISFVAIADRAVTARVWR